MARKPLIGSVAANMAQHGTGAINIDACRINPGEFVGGGGNGCASIPNGFASGITKEKGTRAIVEPHNLGRWPANLIHDGSEEVLAAFPDAPGQMGNVSGNEPSSPAKNVYGTYGRSPASNLRGDTGSAARFFYCAKADRQDRDEGLDGREKKPLNWSSGEQNPGSFQSPNTDRSARNHHPTVKPTALMRYLCKLVTPRGGTILDPFAGSGSTGRAGELEGFDVTMIEQDAEYASIAQARTDYVKPECLFA